MSVVINMASFYICIGHSAFGSTRKDRLSEENIFEYNSIFFLHSKLEHCKHFFTSSFHHYRWELGKLEILGWMNVISTQVQVEPWRRKRGITEKWKCSYSQGGVGVGGWMDGCLVGWMDGWEWVRKLLWKWQSFKVKRKFDNDCF